MNRKWKLRYFTFYRLNINVGSVFWLSGSAFLSCYHILKCNNLTSICKSSAGWRHGWTRLGGGRDQAAERTATAMEGGRSRAVNDKPKNESWGQLRGLLQFDIPLTQANLLMGRKKCHANTELIEDKNLIKHIYEFVIIHSSLHLGIAFSAAQCLNSACSQFFSTMFICPSERSLHVSIYNCSCIGQQEHAHHILSSVNHKHVVRHTSTKPLTISTKFAKICSFLPY